MKINNIYQYFQYREGYHLTVGDTKVLLYGVSMHRGLKEIVLEFSYKGNSLYVYINKPKSDLRLLFSEKYEGLQKITLTPSEKLDSTLLIYLGKFVEEAEKEVEFKLFEWGGVKMITVGALFTGSFVVLVIGIMIAGLVTIVTDSIKK